VSDDSLIELALAETRDKMHKAIDHAKGEFSTIRTGRATPALVERLKIDYFGTETPLRQPRRGPSSSTPMTKGR
jgi:ribosome recycling factor